MIDPEVQKTAEEVFKFLGPACIAIYLGGSLTQPYIKHPHDVDFICFGNKPIDMCKIRRGLFFYQRKHPLPENYDFIQVRNKEQEEHAYGSYVNKQMIKLVGEDIEFKFDILGKDSQEYINILLETIDKLNNKKIRNQKRWYQILRGYYILLNDSYDLTPEQAAKLNEVHDQIPGWEKYKEGVKEWLISKK